MTVGEKVALVTAVVALPTGIGTCTHQALQNRALMVEIEAKSGAMVALAELVRAKNDSLRTVRSAHRRCLKGQIRRGDAGLVGPPEPPPRKILARVGSGMWSGIKSGGRLLGALVGIG